MKLFEDLSFVGTDDRINRYTDKIWHCTGVVEDFSSNKKLYLLQQPYYHEQTFIGYTSLKIFALTEDELVDNFKKVKEDGSLEAIIHSRDNKELQNQIAKITEHFSNMSDEDFKVLIGEGKE